MMEPTNSWAKLYPLSVKTSTKTSYNPVLVSDTYNDCFKTNTNLDSTLFNKISTRYNLSPENIRSKNNSLDTDLSSFTVTENTKVCKNISKLSTIEAMKNQKQQERDCSNQNCKELLKSANRQLK